MKEFFKRLLTFEPTMVRAVLTALVVAAGAFGLDIADVTGRIDTAWLALYGVIPILQGLLTRPAVVPAKTVVEQVDPQFPDDVIAGPANDRVLTGAFVRPNDNDVLL